MVINLVIWYEIARFELSRFLDWIVKGGWKAILAVMGLVVAGTATYTLTQGVLQAQPAFTQAVQITAYVIPFMVYMMAFQLTFQMISMITSMFKISK